LRFKYQAILRHHTSKSVRSRYLWRRQLTTCNGTRKIHVDFTQATLKTDTSYEPS